MDLLENNHNYIDNGEDNRKNLKNFKNCEFEPIKLKKKNNDDEWVGLTLRPDPLHTNYLGPVNDLMDKVEELWQIEVKSFYKTNHLNKNGEGAGGKFNGPSIKTI